MCIYLRHGDNDLDVEGDGGGGHNDDERLAGQQREQGPAQSLAHDSVHYTNLASWDNIIAEMATWWVIITCVGKV